MFDAPEGHLSHGEVADLHAYPRRRASDRQLDMRAESFLRKRPAELPGKAAMEHEYHNLGQENYSLRMIGHDMKSLVGTVISATEMIALELHEASVRAESHALVKDYMGIIQQAGGDMMLLLNSILHAENMTVLEDAMTLHRIHDLRAELEKVIHAFSSLAELKQVRLSLHIPDVLPVVYWDMDKLRLHVISNIVTNALRHTSAGGEVAIEVESAASGMVSILISDTGHGIAPEYRERVFHKHWQGEHSHQFDGICQRGLGLFNAMLVARAHHGNISVVDDARYCGATFRIDLPCAGAASVVEPLHAPPPSPDFSVPLIPSSYGSQSQFLGAAAWI